MREADFIIKGEMPRKKQEESDFGKRLVTVRKARGLTQVQLAERANTTQRAISYYENEAGYPPAPAVVALARVLGVTTDELLGVKEVKAIPFRENSEAQRLWKKFQKVTSLPDKDQRAVIRLINSLASVRTDHSSAK